MSDSSNKATVAKVKSTPLGGKIWFNTVLFGLIGQIAWVVENMYFATFAQNIFQDQSVFGNLYFVSTTLMVIFSAVAATVTTIFAGSLCDKTGKRKPFIAFGYIVWGLTIMLFAAIPINFGTSEAGLVIAMLVIFDCIMTFAGSTANDAAFNTWLTDVTNVSNRGKANAVLSVMPVFAMVVAIVIAMFTFDKGNYTIFFIILGVIPIVTGLISLLTLKDAKGIIKNQNPHYLKETFYGFRKSVIKNNKMMYVCLGALCILGIAQQTFMSYLINFITHTLGIADYVLPLGIVIVVSAVLTGLAGFLTDKFGRKHIYIPLLCVIIAGLIIVYLMKFMPSSTYLPVLIVGGIVMLGSILAMSGALMSTFQDYIPKGYEGRFQGIRMCFTVLIPMIIGPIIALAIGLNSFDSANLAMPPFEIFLAAAIVAVIAIIPIIFVRKDSDRLRKKLLDARDNGQSFDNKTLGTESALYSTDESVSTDGSFTEPTASSSIANDSALSEITAAATAAEETFLGEPKND